jgi:hypothetical protein
MTLFAISAYLFSVYGDKNLNPIPFYSSIVGLVLTSISAITGIANNFFFKNLSNEELKEIFPEHPFKPIRDRFNEITKQNLLVIVIDDLDRCGI